MSPLNYSARALEHLSTPNRQYPYTALGIDYLRGKLQAAQKFLMPDGGRLLDPSKVKPEVSGLLFKPPFSVVAIEYEMSDRFRVQDAGIYTDSIAPKRIALAWEWENDLPAALRIQGIETLSPGVMLTEISYRAEIGVWMPGIGALHIPYEGQWSRPSIRPDHVQGMIDQGRMTEKQAGMNGYSTTFIPLMPEIIATRIRTLGSFQKVVDVFYSDVGDEARAYIDLCYALACKNVEISSVGQSDKVSRSRAAKGKAPLDEYHVLTLNSDGGPVQMNKAGGDGVRSHLRRGHIRRIGPGRITWVNQTIVHGQRHGFINKSYDMKRTAR